MYYIRSTMLAAVVLCVGGVADACKGATPSADELYSRMWNSYQASVPLAGEGVYVRKIVNPAPVAQQQAEAEAEATIARLREESQSWPSARQTELARQLGQIREALTQQMMQREWTVVERYFISGDRYRIDRWIQSNGDSLATIAQRAATIVQEQPDYQIVWNGERCALWDHKSLKGLNAPDAAAPKDRLVWTSEKGKPPEFLGQGRTLPSADFLEPFRKQGITMDVVPGRTAEGEESLVLRIGKPGSVGFYCETTVLPNKGYVMASALVKMNGAVISRDAYSDFVEVSPGVWVAAQIVQEAQRMDKDNVPYISSHLETIAVTGPRANPSIGDDVFDIRPDATTLIIDRRRGRARSFLLPHVDDQQGGLLVSPADLAAEPLPDDARASEAATQRATVAAEPGESQDRRNRELALRPFVYGALIAAGAIAGMLVVSWRRKRAHRA